MPKDYSRTLRVAEQIHRELALLLRGSIRDPRVSEAVISEVEVSRDYSLANVYFTVMNPSDDDVIRVEAGLKSASGYLRRQLGKVMSIRRIPELRFHYDDTQIKGDRISALIDAALYPHLKKDSGTSS